MWIVLLRKMNLGFSIATLLRLSAKTLISRLYTSTLHASSLSFWLRMFCSCSSWWFDGENSNRLFRGYSHPFVMHCRFLFKPNTQRRRIDINDMCTLIELFLFLLTPLPQMPRRIKVNGDDWLICITCVNRHMARRCRGSSSIGTNLPSLLPSSIGKSDFLFSVIVLLSNYS